MSETHAEHAKDRTAPPRCGQVGVAAKLSGIPARPRRGRGLRVAYCQKLPGVSHENVPVDGLRIRRTRF